MMKKTLLFLLVISFSYPCFSKVLLEEDESRAIDEAEKTVEKSQKERKEYDKSDEKTKREMATEKDPKFRKDFEKLMESLKD